ncbi:MAG: hypothetical protein J5892_05320 [Bacilli bacterium]|nr:hypothetical protein [Bacilli bacterium]
MSKIFAKSKLKYDSYLLICIYTLIPLIIFGFYKNGINLYFKGLVSLIYIIKPLLFPAISLVVGIGYLLIFKDKDHNKALIYYNLLISLCISINTNIWLYLGLIVLLDLIYILFLKKLSINFVALSILIIGLVSYLIKDYSFYNHYEIINNHSYGIIDFLIGRSIGGVATTNIILLLINVLILSFLPYYKKDIAIMGLIIYFVCSLWGFVIGYNLNEIINLLCSYSVVFAIIYIAPINNYSPKKERNRYLYIAIICVLAFILVYFFNNVFAAYISILGVNILSILQKLFLKKRK